LLLQGRHPFEQHLNIIDFGQSNRDGSVHPSPPPPAATWFAPRKTRRRSASRCATSSDTSAMRATCRPRRSSFTGVPPQRFFHSQRAGKLQGQPGLANAAGPGQGQQARLTTTQQSSQFGHRPIPPDQPRQRCRDGAR
jgi:hypothetical protein